MWGLAPHGDWRRKVPVPMLTLSLNLKRGQAGPRMAPAASVPVLNSMWTYPKILAHRGGGKLAPENTIAALRCGLEHGYRAVEFDVMLARDNVPVVMHDPYLGRTVPGSGNVFDYDASELQAMNAGAWFGKGFDQETVPLFTDFAAFCLAHGIWMNIEIKPAPGFEASHGRGGGAATTAQSCRPRPGPAVFLQRSGAGRGPGRGARAAARHAVRPDPVRLGGTGTQTGGKSPSIATTSTSMPPWPAPSAPPVSACFAIPSTPRRGRANCSPSASRPSAPTAST